MARSGSVQYDYAGQDYWTETWRDVRIPTLYDLEKPSLRNWIDFQYLAQIKKGFLRDHKLSVIELGCGNSIWLAYFKKYFDAEIFGLDYTDAGCRTAETILAHYGAEGEIIRGDLFKPPPELTGRFDIVFTNGVVEHFEDTADCIRHCAAFAHEGGIIITFLPNLTGLIGVVQKFLDKEIYEVHVPLDLNQVERAHKEAGLMMIEGGYMLPLNLYALNTTKFKKRPWYILLRALLALPTRMIWKLESVGFRLPRNKALSSHIYFMSVKAE